MSLLVRCAKRHLIVPKAFMSLYTPRFIRKPLSEILTELEEPYKIKFSYLDQLIENKQITTSFSRQPLSQALKLILQGTNLAFQIVDFMLPGKYTATSTHTET